MKQTFGVELELEGGWPYELIDRLKRRGIIENQHGLGFKGFPEWGFNVDEEGSLDWGSEIKTSRMTGDQIPLLARLVGILKKCKMRVKTDWCGLHIHVGLQDGWEGNNWYSLRRQLSTNWRKIEALAWRVFKPNEERHQYCIRGWDIRERYQALNVSRCHHNTVEFRLFNASLDMNKIWRAIKFACYFMAQSKKGEEITKMPRLGRYVIPGTSKRRI